MKKLVFDYKYSGISEDEMRGLREHAVSYTNHLEEVMKSNTFEADESSINVPADRAVEYAQALAIEKLTTELKYIIVVGIGGSNLGTKAIYDALRGQLDAFDQEEQPKIIFLDTVSPSLIRDFRNLVGYIRSKDEILINVISKSGGTIETRTHFDALIDMLSGQFGEINDRIVLTTDEGSKLWEEGTAKGISVLSIPKTVGGRYSVFTNVGLFPLAVCGFDVETLVEGAREMRDRCFDEKNIALDSAALIFNQYTKGVTINNNFFFNPELESLGKWYRQLMGESIGKSHDLDGREVHVGITPIVSIGSTDLHSMAQLYFGGPRDKFTNLIYANQDGTEVQYKRVMDAIYGGVVAAYKNNQLPFIEIHMGEISEHVLGQYMQFKMMEMMYLAKFLNVNAFDQPNVEDYKKEMNLLLAK